MTHKSLGRRRVLTQLACGGLLASGVLSAHAGQARSWQLHEFTRIELVPREAGAEPNQHPAKLTPDALRDQLARLRFVAPNGGRVALFANDELAELISTLSQAFERADPAEDVLLLSSARREGGMLGSPMAVTARLFVQDGNLQFIVHDARFEFYNVYRGTGTPPRFVYGSRSAAGNVKLEAADATNRRTDWLSIPTTVAGAAPAAAPAPAATPAPAPAAQPAQAPTPAKAADRSDDLERRLETLKRLREKNLISEDEYQQKRKELLQQL
jgi:hypothetical protein